MNTWMNNPQYLAQVGHFFGAYSLILTVARFQGSVPHLALAVYTALLVAAAIKEFWYDMRYELPVQTWADSIEDFVFYAFGGSAALMVGCIGT